MKKTIVLMLALASLCTSPVLATAQFSDVPDGSWATESIAKVQAFGLMQGMGDGTFGYGKNLSKAEFITILCNMFALENDTGVEIPYTDVPADKWYYTNIATAYNNNILEHATTISPEQNITREEMAVLFVKALGLTDAAKVAESENINFTDVTSNRGYIAVANAIGMINGMSDTEFAPTAPATREQCAAMVTRVYEKYFGETDFLHYFYAISSYGQKELVENSDATTLLWSTMTCDDAGIWLNTGGSNDYRVPSSYQDITEFLAEEGEKTHLGVFMDISQGLDTVLETAENREVAVQAIVAELTKEYEAIGENPYSGVTIDFEGLRGEEQKEWFTAFLTDLETELEKQSKTLYVAVQSPLSDGVYYDGYDYQAISQLADQTILMAYNYNPLRLDGFEGSSYHENAALTPIGEVYYALKTVADQVTDKSKLALGLSFNAVGWKVDADGKLLDAAPVYGSSETVSDKMQLPGSKVYFSNQYRNPYMTYTNEDGTNVFLWFEDQQSIEEKMALARLFGINSVSVWRLGNVPTYTDYTVQIER